MDTRSSALESPVLTPEPEQAPEHGRIAAGDAMKALATPEALTEAKAQRPMAAAPDTADLAAFQKDGPEHAVAPVPEAVQKLGAVIDTNPEAKQALKDMVDQGVIRYPSMKDAIVKGLETGDFSGMKESQASKAFELIADRLAVTAPEGMREGASANAPETPAVSKFEKVVADAKIDPRVVEALQGSAALEAASVSSPYVRQAFPTAPVALKTAVIYAQNAAVKADNFSPEFVQGKLTEAFSQPDNKTLMTLADTQGISIYPPKEKAPAAPKVEGEAPARNLRDDHAELPEGGVYDRAIKAWQAQGAPGAPAVIQAKLDAGQPLNMRDARDLAGLKVLDLDGAKVAREAANPKPIIAKEMASNDQARQVLGLLTRGVTPNLPKKDFMELSPDSRTEVKNLVEAITAGAVVSVTMRLFKELEKKVSAPAEPAHA